MSLGDDDHRLLIGLHHAITDGPSNAVLVRELAALYAGGELPPAPMPFADYGRWLAKADLAADRDYWHRRLANPPPPLALPVDRPRPRVPSLRGGAVRFELPDRLAHAARDLGRAESATLFMTALAAFAALLHRHTGQDDILIGTPVANRHRPGTEGVVGPLINVLPVRLDLAGNPGFRELLRRTRRHALEAFAHPELPYDTLLAELRPEGDRLVGVLFNHLPPAEAPLEVPGGHWSVRPIDPPTAEFDLTLNLAEVGAGLSAWLEYSTDLFDAATAERLAGHFRTLLEGALADPDRPVGDLPLLPDAERRLVLDAWNDTALSVPERTLPELVSEQAARTPDCVAVAADERLTYAELDRRANRLAHHLRGLGVGPDVPVGLCLERGVDLIVAALAIHKAGGGYVPLDPEFPAERLGYYVQDSGLTVLVTSAKLTGHFAAPPAHVVRVDADAAAIATCSAGPRRPRPGPTASPT